MTIPEAMKVRLEGPDAEDAAYRSAVTHEGSLHLRAVSGRVDSNDPLVSFLYVLMRDHMVPGALEGLMGEHVMPGWRHGPPYETQQYSNGYLAQYAMDIAARLRGPQDEIEVLHELIRMLATQVEYSAITREVSGMDTHGQMQLTPDQDELFRHIVWGA